MAASRPPSRRRARGTHANVLARIFRPARGLIAILMLIAGGGLYLKFQAPFAGSSRVIDGDSLMVGTTEIRLFGIDAPEARQTCQRANGPWPCGRAARDHLHGLIADREVSCRAVDTDRFGRTLARCAVGGQDLGAAMVRSGFAIAFGAYDADERDARDAKRGIWIGPFDRPADWRARHPRHAGAADDPQQD